ncbi:hypothetical protein AB7M49_007239 [Bradyrhizobium elkanii]|uniref:Uncharacterized protein n=1 Tax=Bradyrhizobium elkanii TaxID=29448 RepID=A0A8I1YD95_BRAEL|nr:hypothetical protein [Bradyrhizobium elkanii]MCS4005404.1 hypothetical protein [Bradyrhizobium elkanii USDA 61]MBP2426964.1 hypothetical protein [Bradyrhizobium elkanii]MCP1730802.1 hypothetical protein [Bradyrhizobium elkanii]MCP1931359.1 hypothetical protein [Bradyrhizobium elkanii]
MSKTISMAGVPGGVKALTAALSRGVRNFKAR